MVIVDIDRHPRRLAQLVVDALKPLDMDPNRAFCSLAASVGMSYYDDRTEILDTKTSWCETITELRDVGFPVWTVR